MSHARDPHFAQPQGYGSVGFSVAPRSVTYPEIVPATPVPAETDPQFTEETLPAFAVRHSLQAEEAAADAAKAADAADARRRESDAAGAQSPVEAPGETSVEVPVAVHVAAPAAGVPGTAADDANAGPAHSSAVTPAPTVSPAAVPAAVDVVDEPEDSRPASTPAATLPPVPPLPPLLEAIAPPAASTTTTVTTAAAVITEVPVFIERTPQELFNEPAADLAAASTLQKPVTATKGLRGMLGSIGIRLAPGEAEQAKLDSDAALRRDEETIRQATWTRAVSILVANRKGGVGKTPVSLLLGGTLAAVRGGSVCIVEVSDDPGALTFRAEGTPRLGLGELVQNVGTISSAGQLAGYTAPQTSFASVIGTIGDRPPLTRGDVIGVAAVIDEFYSLRVMDSGNQSSSEAFEGAVETADALVIPVLNAGDAVFEALALLDRLRGQGGKAAELADRAIIIRLSDGRPEHPQVVERVNRIIEGAKVAHVVTVPYDAHIAERGQLTLGSLDPATYRVFAGAAAAIVRGLRVAPH